VVKTAGDEFMVAFDSARRAVECAVAVQRARIGLNTGEAFVEGEDLFGAAVDAAKRVQAKAVGDQILVSEIVRGVVGASLRRLSLWTGAGPAQGVPGALASLRGSVASGRGGT